MDLSTNYTYVPPSYCTCSVTLTAVKQTFPDTTLDLFVFSNILDASLAQIATFKIIVLESVYDLTRLGVYTFTATYKWGSLTRTKVSTVSVVDTCIFNVMPPNITNVTKYLMDADSTVNVGPSLDPYYSMCEFSISMIASETTIPDYSAQVIFFALKSNIYYADIPSALVSLMCSSYNLNLLGVYIMTFTYSWHGPSQNSTSFNLTIVDPCLTAVFP